jgi:sulfite exporter TauE/SafE
MLASINPLGERSRNRRWWATYGWYLAGSVLGGVSMGALLGALGVVIDELVPHVEDATAVVVLVLGLVGLVLELHVGGVPLPTVRRQVDENWIPRYRAWVYAGGFGFQLGLGVVTVVTTVTVYLAWALAVLAGSVLGGAVIGFTFGFVRAMPLLLVARADSPIRLRAALQRFAGWAPAGDRSATAAAAAVPIVALFVVLGGAQ